MSSRVFVSPNVHAPSCFLRFTASSKPRISRRGFWPTGCLSGCSCRRTSTSGARRREASKVRAVLLLSGGLDSYTAGAIARAKGYDLFALTVRYGQVHEREVAAARDVAR